MLAGVREREDTDDARRYASAFASENFKKLRLNYFFHESTAEALENVKKNNKAKVFKLNVKDGQYDGSVILNS